MPQITFFRQKCSFGVDRQKNKKAKEGVAQANTCSGAVWAGSSCPIQQPGRARLGSLSHPLPASPAQPWDRALHNPAGALQGKGPCTWGFHMELMPSVLPTGRPRQRCTCSGGLQQEVRIQTSSQQGSLTMQVLSPFLLAEYNLLRFTLK